jgi:hypothetical protein
MNFFPSLLTGALLIHQDYKHTFTPWIHVLQYRLKDSCAFMHSVPQNQTVCFRIFDNMQLAHGGPRRYAGCSASLARPRLVLLAARTGMRKIHLQFLEDYQFRTCHG